MTLPLATAARAAGTRVVLDVHEVRDPLEERNAGIRAYSQWAFRRMARQADAVVTHARSEAARVRAEVPERAAALHVLPHPAYDHYGPRVPRDQARGALGLREPVQVLSFGLVRDYKGMADLVRALPHLPPRLRDSAGLVLVGEMWDGGGELDEAIAESPHGDRVTRVHRYVHDDEVALFFSAADVVALPYRRAAQSGVLQVAKSFGNAVAVSDVGGLPEAVEDYPWKAICRPADPVSLARAVTRAYDARSAGGAYRPYAWQDAVRDLTAVAQGAQAQVRPRPAPVRPVEA